VSFGLSERKNKKEEEMLMPRGGGVVRDMEFIDKDDRKEKCTLTQGAGPCRLKINKGTCPKGVIRGDSGKICYEKCSENSLRRGKRITQREPLVTAWDI
jgi:hypothetical protein